MLKLGYKASAEQFPPRQLLDFAVHAEAVGFDSIMVSDHFQPWRHTGGHAPFSFAWLGALGERTTRALIGTSVVTPTFRYHPAIVAQAIGTLGALYPGRVLLGVGTGESLNEVPATGIAWPPFKERFGRLREAIQLMRRLAREERVTFEGEYFRTDKATDLRPPRGAGADLRRRLRRGRRTARRPRRRRLHLHQRQGQASSTPRPSCRRSPRASRRPAARPTASSG